MPNLSPSSFRVNPKLQFPYSFAFVLGCRFTVEVAALAPWPSSLLNPKESRCLLQPVSRGPDCLIHLDALSSQIHYLQLWAGSEEKLKKCLELGADVGINYKQEDFVERAKAETNGKGPFHCIQTSDCVARH